MPGFELLRKTIQNTDETTDSHLAALAHWFYGMALCWDCQFEKGAESIRKALEIEEAIQRPWAVSALNSNLSYWAYIYHGDVEQGFAISLKALEMAESSADIYSRAVAYVCHGISFFYKGFFTEAEEHLLKGIDLCERIQLLTWLTNGHHGLGHTYFQTGDYPLSQTHYQKAILLRERNGMFPSCLSLDKMALARTALAAGQIDLDVPSLVQLLKSNKSNLYYGIISALLG